MSLPDLHTTRRYVDVIARWRDDGSIVPLSVCWADGRTFQMLVNQYRIPLSMKGCVLCAIPCRLVVGRLTCIWSKKQQARAMLIDGTWKRYRIIRPGILGD